ncbi:MAG: ubiquinol-cytochrome C chaperone family protein [Alphaproteobacteria bacterium]|nr:ubiquinol-cytochrome C chaperone family protein [Alphaproteobacteria bacterium]
MFASLFRKKEAAMQKAEQTRIAKLLYARVLENVRTPFFYEKCKVADTFDGRFDLLLLHSFLILNKLVDQPYGETLSQAYFDTLFRDMDQTLREMGIGDMGIPKHMKKMMTAFNGRMHSYRNAISLDGDEILKVTLRRNLYGSLSHPSEDVLALMCKFVWVNTEPYDKIDDLLSGYVRFELPQI